MWKGVWQFHGQHLQFVVVDVVVGCPRSGPFVKVVVVQMIAQPLQSTFHGIVIHGEAGLNVFMQFNVVDTVSKNAAVRDDGPAQSAVLMGVHDRLTCETWAVGRVVFSNPHGQLTFACSGRNVGSERWVSNEHLTLFVF